MEKYITLAVKYYANQVIENMLQKLKIAVLQEDLKKLQKNKDEENND